MRCYRFGQFTLDTQTRELQAGGGVRVPLTAKAFDTLQVLVEHRDRVVGKDELLATVWAGRVVEENNLSQAIAALRRAFGTSAGDHQFIVTVSGRGYRFVAAVTVDDATQPPSLGVAPATGTSDRSMGRRLLPAIRIAAIALLALGASATWLLWPRPEAPPESPGTAQTTLAVLPFRVIGDGPRDELLEHGLAETLIARVSTASALRVRSSSSSRRLDPKQDPLDAGRNLGAEYVVEGHVQRDGPRVRVGVRLLEVRDGATLWSGTFDEAADDVFTLQDRIATALTQALAVELEAAPWQTPCHGSDAEAYRAYLGGLYQGERPSGMRTHRALDLFRRAIELDPVCAPAYAGMAEAYRRAVITGDADPREYFPLAKAAVGRALEIAPDLAEAHAAQGFIRFWYDWDWAGAEASLRHAIDLNPSLGQAELAYAHLLSSLGRHDEAVERIRSMVALNPLSPLANTLAARFLALAGQHADARRALAKALELEPDFWIALQTRAEWRMREDPAGAIEDLQRASQICSDCGQILSALGEAMVVAGRRDEARQLLQQMEAKGTAGYFPAIAMAGVHNALGDTDAALQLIERGYAERDVGMSFLLVDPRWDNLRSTPRFRAVLARMDLHDVPE